MPIPAKHIIMQQIANKKEQNKMRNIVEKTSLFIHKKRKQDLIQFYQKGLK